MRLSRLILVMASWLLVLSSASAETLVRIEPVLEAPVLPAAHDDAEHGQEPRQPGLAICRSSGVGRAALPISSARADRAAAAMEVRHGADAFAVGAACPEIADIHPAPKRSSALAIPLRI